MKTVSILVILIAAILLGAFVIGVKVTASPTKDAEGNPVEKLYYETTKFYSKETPRFWNSITEYQYKGHSYLYFGSQCTAIHAQHCSCLNTNK